MVGQVIDCFGTSGYKMVETKKFQEKAVQALCAEEPGMATVLGAALQGGHLPRSLVPGCAATGLYPGALYRALEKLSERDAPHELRGVMERAVMLCLSGELPAGWTTTWKAYENSGYCRGSRDAKYSIPQNKTRKDKKQADQYANRSKERVAADKQRAGECRRLARAC